MLRSEGLCRIALLSVAMMWSAAGCTQAMAPTPERAADPTRPFFEASADVAERGAKEGKADAEGAVPQRIDPQAEALMQKVTERIHRAQAFTVDIHIATTEWCPGSNLTLVSEHTLAVKRPDHLAFVTNRADFESVITFGGCIVSRAEIRNLEIEGRRFTAHDGMLSAMILDGKKLYLDIPYYGGSRMGEPPTGRDVLANLFFIYGIARFNGHGSLANRLLQILLSDDATEFEIYGERGLVDDGLEILDGVECQRLRLGPDGLGGYWLLVEDGATPLLRQVRPWRGPTETTKYVDQSTTFRNWTFDAPLDKKRFATPPAKAGKR